MLTKSEINGTEKIVSVAPAPGMGLTRNKKQSIT